MPIFIRLTALVAVAIVALVVLLFVVKVVFVAAVIAALAVGVLFGVRAIRNRFDRNRPGRVITLTARR